MSKTEKISANGLQVTQSTIQKSGGKVSSEAIPTEEHPEKLTGALNAFATSNSLLVNKSSISPLADNKKAKNHTPEQLEAYRQMLLDGYREAYGADSDYYKHIEQLLSDERLTELNMDGKINGGIAGFILRGMDEDNFKTLQGILSDDNIIKLLEDGYEACDVRYLSELLKDSGIERFLKMISNK